MGSVVVCQVDRGALHFFVDFRDDLSRLAVLHDVPTFATNETVEFLLTPVQQAPLPGWDPMPIVTKILLCPVL